MNFLFSLAIPLGVAVFYFGLYSAGATMQGAALAVSAGVFICIAASDLLPEMQFHTHDRGYLSICLSPAWGWRMRLSILYLVPGWSGCDVSSPSSQVSGD